jgi:hypothetical protein
MDFFYILTFDATHTTFLGIFSCMCAITAKGKDLQRRIGTSKVLP